MLSAGEAGVAMGAGAGRMAGGDEGLRSLLAAVVECSPDAVMSSTLDGVITSWNPGAEAVYGYTAQEMVGREALMLFPPGHTGERAAILDRIRAGHRVEEVEARRVRKDGTVIDTATSVSPVRDAAGAVTGAVAVARDITAAKAAREAQSRLAAIVESSPDAIVGRTLDGVITSWNPGAVDMYGYAADEMIGHNVSELAPSARAGELALILDRVRRGQRVENFETQRIRKDGAVIDVSVSVSPIRDAGGAVTGAAAVTRDITERRRAEGERRGAEARLHQAERMETVGQLAGGIAHDFNNLLGAMIGYAELAATEATDPDVRADVQEILSTAQRAAALTRDLLVFSRREPGEPGELDLNAVIAGVQGMLAVSVGEHIQVRVEPAAALPAVHADRGRMEQVLLNLAVNARDAMPEGGVLTITTGVAELLVGDARLATGTDPGRFVELAVSDTGTGMSETVAAHIFEPFFTTKPHERGTGLGLATVYGIITGAGGCLGVDSAPGAGTTFRLYLPAAAAPARDGAAAGRGAAAGTGAPAGRGAAEPAGAAAGPADQRERVLVVDDERSVLEVTSRILRRDGYATLEASTWEEALSLASSHELELLLTDSVMPGMSGDMLADRVRQVRPGLRVLRMSGYANGSPNPRPGRSAAVCLEKPFTADTLLAMVRAVLDGPPQD
jgi:PAS domain S-box-containing protein